MDLLFVKVTLQTMMASRYIKCIQTEVETWTKTLALLGDVMEEWLLCQRNWMYLENIFGAADIQKQLPVEAKKFREVDRSWKKLMSDSHNWKGWNFGALTGLKWRS